MKIVIEIPDHVCEHAKNMSEDSNDEYEAMRAIAKGFPYEERPHEKWEYLKEHITEMRDADGELNQKDTCRFILELMGVIEREGDRNDGVVSL